jgi:hypothetical protein
MMIYLFITMSPLAPLAVLNADPASATTGECAGDCNICGCSPEQRADHTCCCQMKQKLKSMQEASHDGFGKKNAERNDVTIARCSCPCGSGKALALLNLPKSELLPFVFDAWFGRRLTDIEYHENPRSMPSRPGEPPDPPPRLSFIS